MRRSGKVLTTSALLALCLVATMMVAVAAYNIGIFVPGVVAGSPLYEELVSGVAMVAAEDSSVTYKVLEGGFDQSGWEDAVISLAATEEYDLILTSNGAMPFVAQPAAEAFPVFGCFGYNERHGRRDSGAEDRIHRWTGVRGIEFDDQTWIRAGSQVG